MIGRRARGPSGGGSFFLRPSRRDMCRWVVPSQVLATGFDEQEFGVLPVGGAAAQPAAAFGNFFESGDASAANGRAAPLPSPRRSARQPARQRRKRGFMSFLRRLL